jgi:geranylgeranyl pyrophosphate synthase
LTGRLGLAWASTGQRARYARALRRVEQRLAAAATAPPGRLSDACRATLAAGGKRMRPLLTLLCAPADVPLGEPVLRGATAVELLHMATLVHDDVLDRADLRRGRPTVAHEFGVEIAVSAGNFLLARAFHELAGSGDAAAADTLSAAAVGLSEGEVLQRDDSRRFTVTVAEYERRCERKTADLFAAACRLGAQLGGAPGTAAGLAEYGRLLGLAFQVLDDILDFTGDEAATGKRPGTDVRDGTVTLPVLYALEVRPELEALLSRRELSDGEVAGVLRAIAESGALERARAVALGYIERARVVLAECPGPVERGLLEQVAVRVVDRYS